MNSSKRDFLVDFENFLTENCELQRIAFELTDGQHWEGYLMEIGEASFQFAAGGPLSPEEPFMLQINAIDTNTFAYWDDEERRYVNYHGPDKQRNRELTHKPVPAQSFLKVLLNYLGINKHV